MTNQTQSMTSIFNHLDQLKAKLDNYRPLPKSVVDNLYENLVLNWTYHSNAIEGNTLTLLKGNHTGIWSISVSGNWRVTFEFRDGNAYIINYEYYQ